MAKRIASCRIDGSSAQYQAALRRSQPGGKLRGSLLRHGSAAAGHQHNRDRYCKDECESDRPGATKRLWVVKYAQQRWNRGCHFFFLLCVRNSSFQMKTKRLTT